MVLLIIQVVQYWFWNIVVNIAIIVVFVLLMILSISLTIKNYISTGNPIHAAAFRIFSTT